MIYMPRMQFGVVPSPLFPSITAPALWPLAFDGKQEVQSNFNGNCRHFMRCEMILLHHYVQGEALL